MPACRKYLKSVMPVKIYKSMSAIYMTCLSKLSVSAFVPKCDPRLAIEAAILEALDESLMPQDYAERQKEAKELLQISQTHFRQRCLLKKAKCNRRLCNAEDDSDRPLNPVKLEQYKRIHREHCRDNKLQQPRPKQEEETLQVREVAKEIVKCAILMFALLTAVYFSADMVF